MTQNILTYRYEDGEVQRCQAVKLDAWPNFLTLGYDPEALDRFAHIYRQYLVPACPWLFGNMILFHLPGDLALPCPYSHPHCGTTADRITAAAMILKEGVRIHRGKPRFRTEAARDLWQALVRRDSLRIVRGKLPVTTVIPVSDQAGFLSRAAQSAALRVNASFFIMDRFDCATVYDHIGTVLGLCVKDGVIMNPPLYHREALLVHSDGTAEIRIPDISELTLGIGQQTWQPGKNARIYTRPKYSRVFAPGRTKLVIVGNRVAAVQTGPWVTVPASGFVLCPEGVCDAAPGDPVVYSGMEDIRFGIQVGNSILENGAATDKFISRFYNIRALQPVPYPPSLYPLNFKKSRAARIALGADAQGKPMLLWAEGTAKLGHTPGTDSRGATLADMAVFCRDAGMVNAVNLDGGGSAQILVDGQRALRISDREPDFSQAERPIPLGLVTEVAP